MRTYENTSSRTLLNKSQTKGRGQVCPAHHTGEWSVEVPVGVRYRVPRVTTLMPALIWRGGVDHS